jgi:hypothetical protein
MPAKFLLATVLSLIAIAPAAAAFTRVQGATHLNGATSSTTVVVTLPAPVAPGDMVIASVAWASTVADTITGISDDKNDHLVLVDVNPLTTGNFFWQSSYLLSSAITSGAQTFTGTFAGARQFASIVVDEFSGVAGSAALDGHAFLAASAPSTNPDSVSSSAITPTTNGDLIYGSTLNVIGGGTQSAGTGFTQGQITANFNVTEFLTQPTAASIAATMTPTALDFFITYVMAFKAGGGGGPVSHFRLLKDVGQ